MDTMRICRWFFVAALLGSAKAAFGGLGVIHPIQDLEILSGSNYSLTCILEDGKGYTADNLFFAVANYSSLEEAHGDNFSVRKLNRTAIILDVTNARVIPEKKYVYTCKVRNDTNGIGVDLRYVYVGYDPSDVSDFRCVSENLNSLTCTWQSPINPIRTTYNLYYQPYGFPGGSCPNANPNGVIGCTWNLSTSPIYVTFANEFSFSMNISNSLGRLEQFLGKLDHFANVRPAAPIKFAVIAMSPKKAVATFLTHHNLVSLPDGLAYSLSYKIDADFLPDASWQSVDTSAAKVEGYNVTIDVTLPHPHLNYIFSCRIRSATADPNKEYLWSSPAELGFKAFASVPEYPPQMTVGSFELIQGPWRREVIIYWQKLPKQYENGENIIYEIDLYDNLGRLTQNVTSEGAYAKFENIDSVSSKFIVKAANSEGKSENSSEITVPSSVDVETVPSPRALMKVSFQNGTYYLAWNKVVPETQVDSYTVFWCKYVWDRPFQCDGFLEWTSFDATQNEARFDFPDTQAVYQFAIASIANNVSSGMLWSSCTVVPNSGNGVAKIRQFEVRDKNATAIHVQWQLECSDTVAIITDYKLYYCRFDSFSKDCPDEVIIVVASQENNNYVIGNLAPDTIYKLRVSAVTSYAGEGTITDPIFNKTLEGVPTPPLNVKVVEVTNSTLTASWDEPASPNGQILYYRVFCGQFNQNVTDARVAIFRKLAAYTAYRVTVEAYSNGGSSEPSIEASGTTEIGAPGPVGKLRISYGPKDGDPHAEVKWDMPDLPSGPSPHYRVRVLAFAKGKTLKEANETIYETGPNNIADVKMSLCKEDPDKYLYNVSVQAYNPIGFGVNETLYGNWSQEETQQCIGGTYIGTTVLIVVSAIVAFGVVCVALIFAGVRLRDKLEESKVIVRNLELPWGPSVPTLGKSSKSDRGGTRDNSSQSSMKPLFQRISSDLSFTHVIEDCPTTGLGSGSDLQSSHSSVNSSGCSSARDSETTTPTQSRSRNSSDSGAFVHGSSARSRKEMAPSKSMKHSDLDRSFSLGMSQASPSYIQVAPVMPPTLPEGYCKLGLTELRACPSADLFDSGKSGYVTCPTSYQHSPSPSSHSTDSRSNLPKDHYVPKPEIFPAEWSKPNIPGDFEMIETGYLPAEIQPKPSKGNELAPLPIVEAVSSGYVQVGLEPVSTGYVPVPALKSEHIRILKHPLMNPEYAQVGLEGHLSGSVSLPQAFEKKGDSFPRISDVAPGYVQVGLDKSGSALVTEFSQKPPFCGYVTVDAAQQGWSSS